jgi:hypothetical protein
LIVIRSHKLGFVPKQDIASIETVHFPKQSDMKFVKHAPYVKKAKGDSNGALADYTLLNSFGVRFDVRSDPGTLRLGLGSSESPCEKC